MYIDIKNDRKLDNMFNRMFTQRQEFAITTYFTHIKLVVKCDNPSPKHIKSVTKMCVCVACSDEKKRSDVPASKE